MSEMQPWLWIWLLGAPLALGVLDWMRTPRVQSRAVRADERPLAAGSIRR